MTDSIFKKLSEIEIHTMTAKKGNLDYLPWSTAVREVSKLYPTFTWEFTNFDGLPYLATPAGFFVECSVTIEGITRKQMMPVMDHRNNAMMEVKATDINKAQMRALTKAIALHGLGLSLWSGEDAEVIESRREHEIAKEVEKAEKWPIEKAEMLKEYATRSTVKALTMIHTEHCRRASAIGDKGAIVEFTKAKDARIEELKAQKES